MPFIERKHIKYWLVFLLLTLSFTQKADASFLDFSKSLGQNDWDNLKNINLGNNAYLVSQVCEDESGLIWATTNNGLFSYDGYHVQSYPETRKYGFFFSLCTLKDKLVLGNGNGLCVFDTKKEKTVSNSKWQSVGEIRCLHEFKNKVWFCTGKTGLSSWNPATNQLKVECPSIKETVYNLIGINDDLYICTSSGIVVYQTITRKWSLIKIPGSPKKLFINKLFYDKELNCIWGGMEKYPFRYNLKTREVECLNKLPLTTYKSILRFHENILFGTDNGLVVYNPKTKIYSIVQHDSRNSNSLASNIVWALFKDSKNNIWMGTDRGLTYIQNNSISSTIRISSFTKGDGGGNLFTCLFRDSKKRLWMGGVNGLILLEKNRDGHYSETWFQSDKGSHWISHNHVRYIYQDKDGSVWIATDGSILQYNEKTHQLDQYLITDQSGKYNANWAYGIEEDARHNFWIATYGGGLFVVNKKQMLEGGTASVFKANIHFQQGKGPHVDDNSYFTLKDKSGFIWTSYKNGRGLCRINPYTYATIYVPVFNNMNNNLSRIEHLLTDKEGNIWFSAGSKIGKINAGSLKVTLLNDSRISEKTIDSFGYENNHIWFSTTDGIFTVNIYNLQLNCVLNSENQYLSCLYLPEEQSILFGGNDALLCINAQLANAQPDNKSNIRISNIFNANGRIWPNEDYVGESLRFMNSIKLPSSTKDLTIEFSDFSYKPDVNSFSYRIIGMNDSIWTYLNSEENRIYLHQLNYGKYILQLRKGKSPTDSITEFTIEIAAPWYLTHFAFFVYFLLLLGTAYLIYIYFKRKNNRKIERLKQEQSLELSTMKMDFFTNMAHELKTPLTLIIAPISRLISESKNPEITTELKQINENALNLNMLIHKILDFKRMEYNENDVLIRSHIELVAFVQKIVSSYSNSPQYGNIQFHFEHNADTIWANLDYLKINSIITNLISNATRFVNKEDGRIDISVNRMQDNLVLTVKDNGCGIQNKEKNFVFLRLYQASNNKTVREGSGIGLYLVKKFVQLHQGTIQMESQYQIGTSFTITIPINEENTIEAANDSIQPAPKKRAGIPKILLVDDNPKILEFLFQTFSKEYICLKAYDGKEAYELMVKERPDLLITDEMMPEVSGLELCQMIRNNKYLNLTPIIMLTAKDERGTELDSLQIGVDAFITKPFDIDKLVLKAKQLLSTHEKTEKKIRRDQIAAPVVEKPSEELSYDEKFLAKLSKIIEERISSSDFNVSKLSDEMAVDQKQLYRKLKALTGTTPVNFIRGIRLKKAAMLLESKKFTVTEVMYMVGFNNAAYFSECFSAEFGVSPKEYIQR